MPYIPKDQRERINGEIAALIQAIKALGKENRDGALNYSITTMIRNLYEMKYIEQNAAMGVLSCIEKEHYRTQIGPYEDIKIKENGDATDIQTIGELNGKSY